MEDKGMFLLDVVRFFNLDLGSWEHLRKGVSRYVPSSQKF